MSEEKQNGTENQTEAETETQATTASDTTDVTDGGRNTKRTSSSAEGRTKEKRASSNARVKEKTHLIKLHNNSEVPPNGLYIGVNGRWMMVKPNVEMEVPESALEVLDNAVREEAEKDEHNRVVGRREVPRFPYTVVKRR